MAFTYGFYNSLNGDRKYDAAQMASIFDGVIQDGVYAGIGEFFSTIPGDGMQIIVKPGRAWFNHTWSYSDSPIPLSIDSSDVLRTRYDAVVLEVNADQTVRKNSIKIVKGIADVNPVKPNLINTDAIHQHPLAYITINPEVTTITASNIDIRVGKSDCPFVTSILQSVPIDSLFNQWDEEFNTWFDNLKAQLSDDVVTNLQGQIDKKVNISDKATNAQAIAGTDDSKWMTPAKTAKAIDSLSYSTGDIRQSFRNLENLTSGSWLKCDGRTILNSAYPNLVNVIKNKCSNPIYTKYVATPITNAGYSTDSDPKSIITGWQIRAQNLNRTKFMAYVSSTYGGSFVIHYNNGGTLDHITSNIPIVNLFYSYNNVPLGIKNDGSIWNLSSTTATQVFPYSNGLYRFLGSTILGTTLYILFLNTSYQLISVQTSNGSSFASYVIDQGSYQDHAYNGYVLGSYVYIDYINTSTSPSTTRYFKKSITSTTKPGWTEISSSDPAALVMKRIDDTTGIKSIGFKNTPVADIIVRYEYSNGVNARVYKITNNSSGVVSINTVPIYIGLKRAAMWSLFGIGIDTNGKIVLYGNDCRSDVGLYGTVAMTEINGVLKKETPPGSNMYSGTINQYTSYVMDTDNNGFYYGMTWPVVPFFIVRFYTNNGAKMDCTVLSSTIDVNRTVLPTLVNYDEFGFYDFSEGYIKT